MPQCELTAAFMRGIEQAFPLPEPGKGSRWKITIGDLMKLSEWDKVADAQGSWHAIRVANIVAPTASEIHMRMQYALQLGVTELNTLGGEVLKRSPLSFKSPQEFEETLKKLQEDLEFFAGVSHIKGESGQANYASLMKARAVAGILGRMFDSVCTGDSARHATIGYNLAKIFKELKLPKDMALKTARKLLSL